MQEIFRYIDNGYVHLSLLVLMILIIIYLIIQANRTKKLKKRLNQFLLGSDAKSLEEDIASLYQGNKEIKQSIQVNRDEIRKLNKEFTFAFQKIGLIRYDAFSQIGGKLSFCVALMDRCNNGFLLNCVHSTEGCYCYTKEICGGECNATLSEEETKALKMATGE
ncbi:MAG: DUF4446 family protein [Clostridium sp.]|nr:DUF4446 family protein [Clostridium sp.]